jgi:hypothetical protein
MRETTAASEAPVNNSVTVADASLDCAISQALQRRKLVVFVAEWRANEEIILELGSFCLDRAGAVSELPLNPRFSFLPFTTTEKWWSCVSRFSPVELREKRRMARIKRLTTGTNNKKDLNIPDWEVAVGKREVRFRKMILPLNSFIGLDSVDLGGVIRKGHRPIFGHSSRKFPRPSMLIVSDESFSDRQLSVVQDCDLLLINGQRVRLGSARQLAHLIMKLPTGFPAVLVVASPSDLVNLNWREFAHKSEVHIPHLAHTIKDVGVSVVNRDRLTREQEFVYAFKDIELLDPAVQKLGRIASKAWWALTQSVSPTPASEPEFRRFVGLFERLKTNPPRDLQQIDYGIGLLHDAAKELGERNERGALVTKFIDQYATKRKVLVVARNFSSARNLEDLLGIAFGLPADDLARVGVQVCHIFDLPKESCDVVVSAGYFGLPSFETFFIRGGSKLEIVLDPIEARAACFQSKSLLSCSDEFLDKAYSTSLKHLHDLFESYAAPEPSPLTIDVSGADSGGPSPASSNLDKPDPGNTILCFTNGVLLEVSSNIRYSVFASARDRVRTCRARELKTGDQIVTLKRDLHASFSDQLLQVLDAGPYKHLSEARRTWFSLIHSFDSVRPKSHSNIVTFMREHSEEVDVATVRAWLRNNDNSDASAPGALSKFLLFAKALGIALPDEYLEDLYNKIQGLRSKHRVMGRQLVRAIRAAYTTGLHATTAAKIEKSWGLNARRLIESVEVMEVESVTNGDSDG